MILKFRESTISRLERLRKRDKEGSDGQEDDKDKEIVSTKAFVFFICFLISFRCCSFNKLVPVFNFVFTEGERRRSFVSSMSYI